MTNSITQPANLTEQEICLEEAYAKSSRQDRVMAKEFDSALADGLDSDDNINTSEIPKSEKCATKTLDGVGNDRKP